MAAAAGDVAFVQHGVCWTEPQRQPHVAFDPRLYVTLAAAGRALVMPSTIVVMREGCRRRQNGYRSKWSCTVGVVSTSSDTVRGPWAAEDMAAFHVRS